MALNSPSSSPKVTDQSRLSWTTEQSIELYGVRDWGADYFNVSPTGEMVVQLPNNNGSGQTAQVAILDIIQGMKDRGIEMPSILRIENLLDDRIKALNEAFRRAIASNDYQNDYRGVFPIKVNQQCHVVEEIADFGAAYHHGFEAGSKAELIIALAKLKDEESQRCCHCPGQRPELRLIVAVVAFI